MNDRSITCGCQSAKARSSPEVGVDPGQYLETVIRANDRFRRESEIEDLGKRLAIDQLRVALSRPTERLYWLEVNPSERVLELSRRFLSGGTLGTEVFPVIPAVVLKTLEEELLLPEERVRLCEADARQFLEVKPAMAWTRAQQAVALAEADGRYGVDQAVRRSAHLTLAEVAFRLAFRKANLGSELGRPDLYGEASRHADLAGRSGLGNIIGRLGTLERCSAERKLAELILAMNAIATYRDQFESWLAMELAPRVSGWIEALENAMDDTFTARMMAELLPALYQIFRLPDAARREAAVRQKAVDVLIRSGSFKDALGIVQELPDPDPGLLAACYEGIGDFRAAAECHLKTGNVEKALRNYRNIPDFAKALELIGQIKDHPAVESLQWIQRMQELAAQRPAEFHKVILPAEKKLLESILEQSLGVSRKKPAAKRASAPKKPGRPRKSPAKGKAT